MELFAQGLLFGLAIAAPVGPIGILTIRRTLVGGFLFGLLSGLGAATADAIYGTVAVLGLTAVSAFLIQHQPTLQLAGGLFLLYLGIKTLRTKPDNNEQFSVNNVQSTIISAPTAVSQFHHSQFKYFRVYASTLFLTLSNPITILSFTAVFAGFGLGSQTSTGSSILLVVGVFLGSALWWIFLTGLVTAIRGKLVHQGRLNERAVRIINLVSGLILIGFSALLLGNLFLQTIL